MKRRDKNTTGFQHGLDRAIKVFLSGFVTVAIIRALLGAYDLHYLVIIFDVTSIIAIVFLFDKMKYWSFSYLIGWGLGLFMFFSILSPWEIVLYVVIFAFVFFIKFKNKILDIIKSY